MPTGIFRMQAASYNNRSDELAWVQPNTTNKDVVVAVLDTGIDAGHPDLVDNVVGGKQCGVVDGHAEDTPINMRYCVPTQVFVLVLTVVSLPCMPHSISRPTSAS